MKKPSSKVALIHDWLTGMRGGEKVLDVFCQLFPQADLFTLVHIKGTVSPKIESMKIHTSFLQNLPRIETLYRYCLPLMPWTIQQFDLSEYDFILSSSHCVAKGVRVPKAAPHVTYCHTPMRYIWDQYEAYFGPGRAPVSTRLLMRLLRPALQRWDRRTSAIVTEFIANSENVRDRIHRHYGRKATVIHPPINTTFFSPNGRARGDFFLMVTAFAPYKQIEVAIAAFNALRLPLVIAGSGPGIKRLSKLAQNHIRFLGWVSDETLRTLYREARAIVFPGEEDFGMVPLEAQASGCPVIALARGGALESVVPGETGLLFPEASPEALADCVRGFRGADFNPAKLRENAQRFSAGTFRQQMMNHLTTAFPHINFGWGS